MERCKQNKHKYCVVPQCKNIENPDLSYHNFPAFPKLKKLWLKKLRLKYCTSSDKVCSEHFSSDDYFTSSEWCIRKKLKPSVIPNRNLPKTFVSQKQVNQSLIESRARRHLQRNLKKTRSELKATCNGINDLSQEIPSLEGFIVENNPEKQPDPTTTIESNQNNGVFNSGYLVFQDNSLLECNIFNDDIFSADNHNSSSSLPSDNSFESNVFLAAESQINIQPVTSKVTLQEKTDAATQTRIDDSDPTLNNKVDVGVQITQNEIKKFSIGDLLKTDEHLNAFTGIGSLKLLDSLITCMAKLKQEQGKNKYTLSHKDRILLTMMRVKMNISYTCLSVFFSVYPNTCKNTFLETIYDLSIILLPVIRWPPKEEILKNMPQCFQKYTSTVGVLNCTEMKVEKVDCFTCKIRTFSFYKGSNTSKIMICVTPSGLISYVSSCYGGRSSDKQIFNQSNIVEKKTMPNRDSLMVDKGFLIEAECALAGVKLIRPPFCKNKKLTRNESHETASIAAARVNVERTIQRIKQFELLKSIIPYYLIKSLDYILITVCGLVNLIPPILGGDKFL